MSTEVTIINDIYLAFKKFSQKEEKEERGKRKEKKTNKFVLREYKRNNYFCGGKYFRLEN